MNFFENNEKLKLAKAILNHTKTIANEYIEKHSKSTINNDTEENEFYEQIMLEIEENKKIKSTWAKALSQCEGDDKKAQSLYIRLRISELIQEKNENIAIYEEYYKIQKIIEEEKLQLKKEKEEKELELKKKEEEKANLKKWLEEDLQRSAEYNKQSSSNKENNKTLLIITIGIILLISIIISIR